MQELLFQFIWQYSLYKPVGLKTATGETVTVVHPGRRNTDAGPDFLEARIRIGKTLLIGNVELHVLASDWLKHGHERDLSYRNIILHVVHKNDVFMHNAIPVLELQDHITPQVLEQYNYLVREEKHIACHKELHKVGLLTKENWLARLLAERWEYKFSDWQELLVHSSGDWRNLLYWRMAANFGFKTNASPFLMLARSIPLNVLSKHKESLLQTEAVLFGQAGMLQQKFHEDYPLALQQEYAHLRSKYKIKPLPAHLWKFLRMRPANFPSIRIAQFAQLVHRSVGMFSSLLESPESSDVRKLLDVKAGVYWDDHFRFEETHEQPHPKKLGTFAMDNIIINTIAPIQFLYGYHHGQIELQQQAIALIESVDAEENNITRLWQKAKWAPVNAAQSQAQIQLYNHYCTARRCLECSIGLGILRSKPVP